MNFRENCALVISSVTVLVRALCYGSCPVVLPLSEYSLILSS